MLSHARIVPFFLFSCHRYANCFILCSLWVTGVLSPSCHSLHLPTLQQENKILLQVFEFLLQVFAKTSSSFCEGVFLFREGIVTTTS